MTRLLRRLVPSPAMLVALVALFTALGGSAYALVVTGKTIRNNTVRNVDIRNGTLLPRDHKRDALGSESINEGGLSTVPSALVAYGGAHYAVATADGIFVRGRGTGANPVARTGPGRYQVTFDGDVRGCAYFATVGDASAAGPPQGSEITTSSLGANPAVVTVRTEASGGQPVDRPFHLVVFC